MTFRLQNCAATGYSWWLVAPHIAWGRPSECGVAPFPLSPRHRGTIAPLASIALSIASTFQRWTLERVLHSMFRCLIHKVTVQSFLAPVRGLVGACFFACFLHFFTN